MKYQWIEAQPTCQELEDLIGYPVKSITRGEITVGYQDGIIQDGKGGEIQVPVRRKGIEIEFTKEPGPEVLARLDAIFPDLRREGGKTAVDEIAELKTRVKQVEDQLKETRG